jgi:hypothetical protein
MRKIYISGKITGLPFGEVQAKFEAAKKFVAGLGHEAVSPLENGVSLDYPWIQHLKMDIMLLMDCDAIYLLSDRCDSRGAMLEKNIAETPGMETIYEKEDDKVFSRIKQAVFDVTGILFSGISGASGKHDVFVARLIYARHCIQAGASYRYVAKEINRSYASVAQYAKRYDDEYKFNGFFRQMAEKVDMHLKSKNNNQQRQNVK